MAKAYGSEDTREGVDRVGTLSIGSFKAVKYVVSVRNHAQLACPVGEISTVRLHIAIGMG